MHDISLRPIELWFPRDLKFFVHDWICCEHISQRWGWRNNEMKMFIYDSKHPLKKKMDMFLYLIVAN